MFEKIKEALKRNKETILAIIAIIAIPAILCFIFKDVISALVLILVVIVLAFSDNINYFIQRLMSEKEEKQARDAQQAQIVYDTLAKSIFQGLTGPLGKFLGAMPPQEVEDVYPTTIPPIQTFNGVREYRVTVYRTPGSQPIPEAIMKRLVNSYLQRVSSSGLLPPKPGSTFWPYFHTLAVTPDTVYPDTFNFHIIYVEDAFTEEFLNNRMCEEAEEWRRKLVDTQPPDDEEF